MIIAIPVSGAEIPARLSDAEHFLLYDSDRQKHTAVSSHRDATLKPFVTAGLLKRRKADVLIFRSMTGNENFCMDKAGIPLVKSDKADVSESISDFLYGRLSFLESAGDPFEDEYHYLDLSKRGGERRNPSR